MKRRRMPRYKDKKVFMRTASRTRAVNLLGSGMRGGTRF